MSARSLVLTSVALLGGLGQAAAHLVVPLAVAGSYFTPGRLWSMVGMLFGLVGVVVGNRARARSARVGGVAGSRNGAGGALAAGVVGLVIGVGVVAAADGGPGTGYGIVGGFIAIVVGLVAAVLASLTLVRRAHRTA
jgi:hypothetical protein